MSRFLRAGDPVGPDNITSEDYFMEHVYGHPDVLRLGVRNPMGYNPYDRTNLIETAQLLFLDHARRPVDGCYEAHENVSVMVVDIEPSLAPSPHQWLGRGYEPRVTPLDEALWRSSSAHRYQGRRNGGARITEWLGVLQKDHLDRSYWDSYGGYYARSFTNPFNGFTVPEIVSRWVKEIPGPNADIWSGMRAPYMIIDEYTGVTRKNDEYIRSIIDKMEPPKWID